MDGYGEHELVQSYGGGDDNEEEYDNAFSKVPCELREEMLARVSCVTQLFRLRLVCKAWNSLIASQTLAKLHAQISYQQRQPWFLVARRRLRASPYGGLHISPSDQRHCSNHQELLYLCKPDSMAHERWIAPPLPFMSRNQFAPSDLFNCRSDGGFVCCIASRPASLGRGKAVLIFNPLTRAFKYLPVPGCFAGLGRSFTNSASLDMVMCRDRSMGHFRVAVCDTANKDVRVFDSRKGHWIMGARPPSSAYNDQRANNMSMIKPRFQGYRCADDQLYWYNLEENTWLLVTLPSICIGHNVNNGSYRIRSMNSTSSACPDAIATSNKILLKCPTVFKGDDSSLMLAAVLLHPSRGLQGFGVWRLVQIEDEGLSTNSSNARRYDSDSDCTINRGDAVNDVHRLVPQSTWSLISRTPAAFLQGGKLHGLSDSALVCHPNYVCMTGLLRMSVCPWRCFYPWILAFDAAQCKWTWSPHPLGQRTWANFQVVSIVDPNLESIP